ncbi:SusD family protein [Mucilaginibacter pineti]|uniref:SusD family protein n=1 Tax=Mucilaginibacter pineti TaxID=1391627 RepID=A0A1G7ER88_9SPHI|nr:RagB/SusD family nutrient uptake outer membrane protein [Mucilaginibacter pineti]SDE66139.1 SusD family protein [Mucilaginibacter pineti]
MKNYRNKAYFTGCKVLSLILLIVTSSCNKLIDIPAPEGKVSSENAFANDASATSAVLGIYSGIASFQWMLTVNNTVNSSLMTDELTYNGSDATYLQFYRNSISSNNTIVEFSFWQKSYESIYRINSAIEGLTSNTLVKESLRNQLLGECKFLRAFTYFYLINYFGDVPLVLTSDYRVNAKLSRTNSKEVEESILADLLAAQSLLQENYPTNERVRANKWTATALLARFYLYQKQYLLAETASTSIINSTMYSLVLANLNDVFLAGSSEAIFQFKPSRNNTNTEEGAIFVPSVTSTVIPNFTISTALMNKFELGDKRKAEWIGTLKVNDTDYFYPFKYKQGSSFTSLTEYLIIFRLAEQYLVRAEARAQQGNLTGAISDINIIRARSRDSSITGALPNLPTTLSNIQTLDAIEKERAVEFFVEQGFRWIDLKRTNRIDVVMKSIKPTTWETTDGLYPIPANQILVNTALLQNPGYN